MERLHTFLPSVLAITSIAVATLIYLTWITKHYGENLKDVKWCHKNRWKLILAIGTPRCNVFSPAWEELAFRAPLIIAFEGISHTAWYGIFASSALFALLHTFRKKAATSGFFLAKEDHEFASDGMDTEIKESRRIIAARKGLAFISIALLGIVAGYYGITYQSIWIAVGIHSAWNLVMPIVISILLLITIIVLSLFISVGLFVSNCISKMKR